MDHALDRAIARALACDRDACAAYGATFTWEASARQFVAALACDPVPLPEGALAA